MTATSTKNETPLLDELHPGKSATMTPERATELERKIKRFCQLMSEIAVDIQMKKRNGIVNPPPQPPPKMYRPRNISNKAIANADATVSALFARQPEGVHHAQV